MNYIETIPKFDKNNHYKEYSPYEGGYKYRFVTLNDINFYFTNPLVCKGQKILFKDKQGRVWMTMTSHTITISKKYAWDGCTPKIWWGIWWGSPDFESTVLASLLHDSLIQFQKTINFPFTRYEIDQFFKYILCDNDFILTDLYYIGVRIGSSFSDKIYDVNSELTLDPVY
jgi:hypothetical protein